MQNVNIITSFVAGVVMFLAPCTLPIVPGFIAFISGREKKDVVKQTILFTVGFLLTFLFFGVLAGLLGHILSPVKIVVEKIGAIFVAILGLYLLGIFKLPFFQGQIFGENFRQIFKGKFSPFIFGISIALGWTPCVGPVLAGIFFYATFAYSVLQAIWLFLFFSLGFIIPFLFVSILIKRGKNLEFKSSKIFSIFAGLILLFISVLIFTNNFNLLAGFFYKILRSVNYESINNLL